MRKVCESIQEGAPHERRACHLFQRIYRAAAHLEKHLEGYGSSRNLRRACGGEILSMAMQMVSFLISKLFPGPISNPFEMRWLVVSMAGERNFNMRRV